MVSRIKIDFQNIDPKLTAELERLFGDIIFDKPNMADVPGHLGFLVAIGESMPVPPRARTSGVIAAWASSLEGNSLGSGPIELAASV